MFAMIAAGMLACGQCCGSRSSQQVIPPIINNNIVSPPSSSCQSSKVGFVKEIIDEVRSIEGNAGSLNGYDSDTEIDVHVRVRTESHIDTSDLAILARKAGCRDLVEDAHKGEVYGDK